jgi:two-component system sensor histidine kinase DegS
MNEPLRTHDEGVVRSGTTSLEGGNTYTRPQMESGAVGISHDVPVSDAPDVDSRMAMALLAAHEQERSRLAEELHDGPAQALANAIFQTEIVDRAVREDPSTARAELASLRQLLERELDTLRGYINQLRPSLGEAAGLDDALRDSANAMSQRAGVPVELSLGAPDTELHEAARTVVLRVAQEALRNIAKHSGATRAWVRTFVTGASHEDSRWVLEVGDNGRGFDLDSVAANPNRRHFGLRFMRERSDLLGSQLSIQTSTAAGTVVRLTINPREER